MYPKTIGQKGLNLGQGCGLIGINKVTELTNLGVGQIADSAMIVVAEQSIESGLAIVAL
ncbi:hypothetical protein [Spirosoma validum]|uniref:Uncharacterized protein n=1 Tax=Spirosoma validum TaxID=2771355 RepID=A0A927B8J3_9BACT|nr:hypothetical protein [Spirosoma validum]MBD2757243.1 hypothetical protein [Spirosoma validum]